MQDRTQQRAGGRRQPTEIEEQDSEQEEDSDDVGGMGDLKRSMNDLKGLEGRIEEQLAPLRDLGANKLSGLEEQLA